MVKDRLSIVASMSLTLRPRRSMAVRTSDLLQGLFQFMAIARVKEIINEGACGNTGRRYAAFLPRWDRIRRSSDRRDGSLGIRGFLQVNSVCLFCDKPPNIMMPENNKRANQPGQMRVWANTGNGSPNWRNTSSRRSVWRATTRSMSQGS